MTTSLDSARPNELFNVEFTVTNTDAVARTGVVLTTVFPAELNGISEGEFDGDCPSTTCTAGETVTWTLGTIGAGDSRVVDLPALVPSAQADGSMIVFDPQVTDDSTDVTMASTTVLVTASMPFELILAEDADPALAGSELTYRLDFAFRADAGAVTNSLLSLPVPAGATFVSATGGGFLNGSIVEWPLGFLSPGDQGTREVTVALDAALDAGDIITAQAQFGSVAMPADGVGSEAATVIAQSQPLGLAFENVVTPARRNELTNMQFTVTNNDPFTRFGVVLTARYPQILNSVSEAEFDGDCASTTCTAGERLRWQLGDIPAGGSATVDLIPVVFGSADDGTVVSILSDVSDLSGAATRGTLALRVQNTVDYDLALAEDADPVTADSLLTYKLSYGYRESATSVNNSELVMTLPDNVSFVSATRGGTLNGNAVEWPLGFLSPGDSGIREVTVQVDSGAAAATVLNASAEVSSISEPLARARAEANTIVAGSRPLGLSIEMNPNPARGSEMLHAQLSVTNNDPFTRFGVELRARYPQDLNSVSEANFDGDCASTTCTPGERVTWQLGNIPAGGSVTVDVSPLVTNGTQDGTAINLFAWATDDAGAQSRLLDSVQVDDGSRYDLSMIENADPVSPGAQLEYDLHYAHLGDATAVANSTLRFDLPVGTTLVSTSAGGALNGNAV
ncbi:MAG: hypothetical protein AAFN78_16440, partial [Pseudomonadota bacterium]